MLPGTSITEGRALSLYEGGDGDQDGEGGEGGEEAAGLAESLMEVMETQAVKMKGCHGKDAPCPMFEAPLVATLKKGMYISLVHPIGQSLAIMLTKDIHEPLQKMLHAGEGMPVCVYDSTKY